MLLDLESLDSRAYGSRVTEPARNRDNSNCSSCSCMTASIKHGSCVLYAKRRRGQMACSACSRSQKFRYGEGISEPWLRDVCETLLRGVCLI